MKSKLSIWLLALCLLGGFSAEAQFGKKLKDKLAEKMAGGKSDGSGKKSGVNPAKLPGPYLMSSTEIFYENKPYTDFYTSTSSYRERFSVLLHLAKGMYKGRMPVELQSNEYSKKHLMKFAEAGDTIFNSKDHPELKQEDGKIDDFYCRAIKTSDGAYLMYYGEMEQGIMKQNAYYLAAGYFSSFKHFVLAPSQELIDKWSGEAGIAKIQAFEDKAKAHYWSVKIKEAASVRMPKAGKMDSNAALKKQITGFLKKKCADDGTTFKRMMITANDWEVVRDKYTKKILYRRIWGYFADSKPGRQPGDCMIFGFYLTQKYDGTKYISDNPVFDCCSQDVKYGPVILCENINK